MPGAQKLRDSHAEPGDRRDHNGVSYLARDGDGPTIVFLHGIGSNATSFAGVFDRLPTHLNLVAWDAPGYGSSTPLAENWPVANDYAHRLAQVLEGIGTGPVHMVGHSLGTLIAASFAQNFPTRVLSLTLAAAANGYKVPVGGVMPDKVSARIEDLARLGPAQFASMRAANLVHDPGSNPDIVAQVEVAMSTVNPDGYTQAVRMLASGDLPGDLAQTQLRPGFILGAQDRVTPMDQTKTAATAWTSAHGCAPPVIEIEGAGHAVYLQKPTEFCAALLDLLKLDAAMEPKLALQNMGDEDA